MSTDFFFLDTPPGWERRSITSPSLVLPNVDEGSSADGCSGPDSDGEGEGKRDWLLLLLVSLLKTGDGLVPLLWMEVELQSSPGCFFWMSGWVGEEGQTTDKQQLCFHDPSNCAEHHNKRKKLVMGSAELKEKQQRCNPTEAFTQHIHF